MRAAVDFFIRIPAFGWAVVCILTLFNGGWMMGAAGDDILARVVGMAISLVGGMLAGALSALADIGRDRL